MSTVVSVVIPAYNRPAYLREALDSVAGQTCRDLETIVVDDGSSENLEPVVVGHAVKPRFIRQDHRGAAAARNRGIAEARGEWIAFLDSDDLWLPAKLERYFESIRASPDAPIWYGPMDAIDEHRRPVAGRTKACHAGRITPALFESTFVHVPTVVCRRTVLLEHGGFDESLRVCEDHDLWLRISVRHPFGLVEPPLALRRLHAQRLSKSSMPDNMQIKFAVLERFFRSHPGELDERTARARLASVAFSTARELTRAGRHADACAYFSKSRGYGGSLLRAAPRWAYALTMRALRSPAAMAEPRSGRREQSDSGG